MSRVVGSPADSATIGLTKLHIRSSAYLILSTYLEEQDRDSLRGQLVIKCCICTSRLLRVLRGYSGAIPANQANWLSRAEGD